MSGHTFNVTNKFDGTGMASVPVSIIRPKPELPQLIGAWIGLVLHHLTAAFFLWLVFALLMPQFGITYITAYLSVLTARILTYQKPQYPWWSKPPVTSIAPAGK